jgi:LAO/AO transport system kinase
MVDFFLVLMLAGAGDELQGIKKGILELADAVAINKADGKNRKPAEKARQDYENALHYLAPHSPVWRPVVRTMSSMEHTGIDTVWNDVLDHRKRTMDSGLFMAKRRKQSLAWMQDLIDDTLKRRFYETQIVKENLPRLMKDVEEGRLSPGSAVKTLFPAGG